MFPALQTGLPGGLPDARRQKNNKITVLFYQMNVNKPLLFGKDGVMLKKVKETKIDTL